MRLFNLEIKRILKSYVFWIVAIILVFSVNGQISDDYVIKKPVQYEVSKNNDTQGLILESSDYGAKIIDDMSIIYPNLLYDLYQSTESNHFTTYPYGFYKTVVLSEDKLNLMKKLIEDMAKVPYKNLLDFEISELPNKVYLEAYLSKIDALLGGGSHYSPKKYMSAFGKVQMTYEEALSEYDLMKENGFDTSFVRYFSDYSLVFITFLIWFIPLMFWIKDKISGISVVYIRTITTFKLVFTRILAMTFLILMVMILDYSYYEIKLIAIYGFENMNILKAYGILIMWILPNILLGVSIGSLVTIITENILVGIIGPFLSFTAILISSANLFGDYGWSIILRHNTIGYESYFIDNFKQVLLNRSLWLTIGILICIFSVIMLKLKREGYYVFKRSKTRIERNKA